MYITRPHLNGYLSEIRRTCLNYWWKKVLPYVHRVYWYIVLKMIISIGLVYIYYLYALKATLKFSFNPKSEERVEASGVYNFC